MKLKTVKKSKLHFKKSKNPINQQLLDNLVIKKEYLGKKHYYYDRNATIIEYEVFFEETPIAIFDINITNNRIYQSFVNKNFRRQGIASYLYDYIEKDLGIKIQPDIGNLSSDSIEFWKKRIKRINPHRIRTKKTRNNPTDQNLIIQLHIRKSPSDSKYDPDLILYSVLLNSQIIAKAYYDPITQTIISVEVYEKENRKRGIGTFLYDFIEKDQGIILKPSEDLLSEGKLFWKARLKRKNPSDESLLAKIKIKKLIFRDNINQSPYRVIYKVLLNNKEIAEAQWDEGYESISWVYVKPEFQRRGIATFLYDYIEKDLNLKLRDSGKISTSAAGKLFWEARLKRKT